MYYKRREVVILFVQYHLCPTANRRIQHEKLNYQRTVILYTASTEINLTSAINNSCGEQHDYSSFTTI